MNQKSIEKLKQLMITTYRKFGDEKALMLKGRFSYTGNEIAKEIENETEFGIEVLNSLLQLTIDLLKRNKIKMK